MRHPGHYIQLKTMNDLGLFDPEPIEVANVKVPPRAVLAKLFEPKVTFPEDKDVVVIRVKCLGEKDGRPAEAQVDLMDFYDDKTEFTAMERTTGWDISIVAIMMANGQTKKGAVPLELAISSSDFVHELGRRGISISEKTTFID